MATFGNTYEESDGIRQDLLDVLTKVNKNATPLVNMLESVSATNTVHLWPFIQVAPSVTGYGSTGTASQNAQIEGATIAMAAAKAYTNLTNYTQILYIPFNISRTQMRVVYAGVPNYVADQMEVAMQALGQDLENAVVNGVGATGSTAVGRQMNGLGAWATANTATGAATAFATTTGNKILEGLLQKIYVQSKDHADFVLVNPSNKSDIDGWTASVTRYQEADKYELSAFINVYQSSFGAPGGIRLIMDNFVNANTFYAGKLETLFIAYLDKPFAKELATIADGQNYYVRTEATLEARNPLSLGTLTIA